MSNEMNNHDEVQVMMAEYLGGELDEAGRAKFETMMEGDEQLALEVKTLRAASDAIGSLDDEDAGPVAMISSKPASSAASFRGHALRYTAVIALAFLGGYIIRGLEPIPGPGGVEPEHAGGIETNAVDNSGDDSGGEENFEHRLTREYLNAPERTGLSRSLIAYARATRIKRE